MIFASYWGSPLVQFSKFNNFLWACWFLCKNLSNFVPLSWKLHNPCCHSAYGSLINLWFNLFFSFQYNGAPWGFTEILSYFNLVFTALFTVECAFKLMSFGPKVSPKCRKFKILWMKDSCLNVNSKVKRNMNAQLK